jgi:hypothetical protein
MMQKARQLSGAEPGSQARRLRRLMVGLAVVVATLAAAMLAWSGSNATARKNWIVSGSVASVGRTHETFAVTPSMGSVAASGCKLRTHAGSPSVGCPVGPSAPLAVLVRIDRSARVELCRQRRCLDGSAADIAIGRHVDIQGLQDGIRIRATRVAIEQ